MHMDGGVPTTICQHQLSHIGCDFKEIPCTVIHLEQVLIPWQILQWKYAKIYQYNPYRPFLLYSMYVKLCCLKHGRPKDWWLAIILIFVSMCIKYGMCIYGMQQDFIVLIKCSKRDIIITLHCATCELLACSILSWD